MLRFAVAMACALALAACASITRGTSEAVVFDSDPPGAEMRSVFDYPCGGPCPVRENRADDSAPYIDVETRTPIEPGPACVTPCTIQVARKQKLIVTFSKSGYAPQTVKLGHAVSASGGMGVAGNLVAGGAVGLAVDTGTGAGYDHAPNPLKVVLAPLAGGRRRATP